MDDDRLDAELLAGAQHPEGDLAAVGYEDFLEHAPLFRRYSMTTSGMPYSTGWASSTRIAVDRAGARRRNLVHRLHRLDDQQGLPSLTAWPTLDEGLGVRRRRQVGGAHHRRGHGVLRRIGGRGSRGGNGRSGRRSSIDGRWVQLPHGPREPRLDTRTLKSVELDFDLGQVRLVRDPREVADQLLVDAGLFCRHFKAFSLSGRRVRAASACSASVYPIGPRPQIMPNAWGATLETWRKGSRAWMFDRCTSTTGSGATARIASWIAIEVWVYAPALSTMPCASVSGLLDPVDQDALVIGLAEIHLYRQLRGSFPAIGSDIVQGLCSIDLRLALAERIEIGAVQNENRFQAMDLFPRRQPRRAAPL